MFVKNESFFHMIERINQSIDRSIDQSINQSINEFIMVWLKTNSTGILKITVLPNRKIRRTLLWSDVEACIFKNKMSSKYCLAL